jgi:hypothetical protein
MTQCGAGTGTKRETNERVNVASSPASAPSHQTTAQPQAPAESDEGRMATCMMLGRSPTVSQSASSSSDSSGS